MPKFTIGVPTFNRAALLAESLRAAVNQTYGDLEIIISDNASTDETAKVVQQFGDRVRYFRNETNLGPIANFFRLVELASGKYFSWLQDDDCIFSNFVERAAAGLDRFPQAAVYGAYAAVTPRLHCLATSWLYGPPLPLDWPSRTARSFRGDLIAPLSLCVSVAIPPVVAFRTDALRAAAARCDRSIPLFIERTLLADVACRGEAVFDPFVAGEFRSHADQTYRVIQAENPDAFKEQWQQMARQLDALPLKRNWRWRQRLCQAVREITPQQRQQWKQDSQTWPEDISLCRDMRAALTAQPPPKRVPLSPSGIAKAGMRAARSLLSRVID
jgi:glycosyltransferase involved in cell wall biosynthesis